MCGSDGGGGRGDPGGGGGASARVCCKDTPGMPAAHCGQHQLQVTNIGPREILAWCVMEGVTDVRCRSPVSLKVNPCLKHAATNWLDNSVSRARSKDLGP